MQAIATQGTMRSRGTANKLCRELCHSCCRNRPFRGDACRRVSRQIIYEPCKYIRIKICSCARQSEVAGSRPVVPANSFNHVRSR